MRETEHGTEDFRLRQFASRRVEFDHGGANEVPLLITGDLRSSAVHQHTAATCLAALHEAFDPRAAFRRDDRAHFHIRIEAVADTASGGGFEQLRRKRLPGFSHRHRHRSGQASLTGAAKRRIHRQLHRHVDVGIRHHDDGVLGPALALDTFAGRRRARVDILGDG